jgi:hypothetical protein
VDSFGLFTLMAKDLSPHLKLLYRFDDKYVKGYIPRGEWRNLPAQRALMVNLPEENIFVDADWRPCSW